MRWCEVSKHGYKTKWDCMKVNVEATITILMDMNVRATIVLLAWVVGLDCGLKVVDHISKIVVLSVCITLHIIEYALHFIKFFLLI